MYFKPTNAGATAIESAALKKDKQNCEKFYRCGVGDKAVYISRFTLDRMSYVNIADIKRVFKRVAMSKGAYTGKGAFASIGYFVIHFRAADGKIKERQLYFKYEDDVDAMLACIRKKHPEIPVGKDA